MSLFRRIFGKSQPASPTSSRPDDSEKITIYDKYGRQMQISKGEWRNKVLGPNLKQAWDDPDQLYSLILGAFNDRLFLDVIDAAERLNEIDPHPERAATTLAIAYQQTEQPDRAEKLLLAHIEKHGESGIVLTNLAKAQDALHRHDEAKLTLWSALEKDPNLDNALLWYEAIEREKRGPSAGLEAFQRVAELPGAWRPQLWIARAALEEGNLDQALALYQQSLETAGDPAPADALQQITGDLGQRGHLSEAINIVSPRYDYERHGLQVGNNLIKAYFDLGQLDHARSLLTQLQTLQRPDFQETLAYWENAISKVDFETRSIPKQEAMQIQVVPVNGPLWLRQDHSIAKCFPQKETDSPLIAFTGCSIDQPNAPAQVTATQTNSSGRFTRALPLYLAERIHIETTLRSRAPIPMVVNQGGGLVVTSGQTNADGVSRIARMTPDPNDTSSVAEFAFDSHLVAQGENWTLLLRFIRTIDSKVLNEFEYSFPENGYNQIASQVLAEIYQSLESENLIEAPPTAPPHTEVNAHEVDHYLLRLEQSFATRCAVNLPESENFLHHPSEIISGTIHLCIQNPKSLPSRFILWRTLDAIKQLQPELALSFAEKVSSLQKELPIEHPAYHELTHELETLLTAP